MCAHPCTLINIIAKTISLSFCDKIQRLNKAQQWRMNNFSFFSPELIKSYKPYKLSRTQIKIYIVHGLSIWKNLCSWSLLRCFQFLRRKIPRLCTNNFFGFRILSMLAKGFKNLNLILNPLKNWKYPKNYWYSSSSSWAKRQIIRYL